MLKHLHIQNYALISSLDIDFTKGFSVITGETGAGKSIILGALALVMGERADSKSVTEGEQKCVVEAEFLIDSVGLESFFTENDLDYAASCTIRRELAANGKSRAFVNDTPVSLTLLRSLTDRLIDIHSQHENLLLKNDEYQLGVLDSVASNNHERMQYAEAYNNYIALGEELRRLQALAEKSRADADYVQFQYNQLSEANLEEAEEERLEQELQLLQHAEDIKSNLTQTISLLDGESTGALSIIKEAVGNMRRIGRYLPQDNSLTERLESAYIELRDITDEAAKLEEHTEFDPERLQQTEQRLDLLNTLMQKHRCNSSTELIALRDSLREQLQRNESFDEQITALQKQLSAALALLTDKAKRLTATRYQAAAPIATQLQAHLASLGIPHAKVEVLLTPTESFTPNGKDFAQFLFAANKNQSLRPVAEVASGGEISRLMLTIKALTAAERGLATIIFDEVDTGVSGEVADNMGVLMQHISQGRQIIAITHLPQIAAKGEIHYKVYKQDSKTRTETHIRKLTQDERVQELAALLSGENITTAALDNARDLLHIKDK